MAPLIRLNRVRPDDFPIAAARQHLSRARSNILLFTRAGKANSIILGSFPLFRILSPQSVATDFALAASPLSFWTRPSSRAATNSDPASSHHSECCSISSWSCGLLSSHLHLSLGERMTIILFAERMDETSFPKRLRTNSTSYLRPHHLFISGNDFVSDLQEQSE